MNRTQQYLVSLLEKLPAWELENDEQRTTLEQLRQRVAGADDLDAELRTLFRVRGCGDLALSLLWIAGNVESDPSRLESDVAEEQLVFSRLRSAFGTTTLAAAPSVAPAEPVMDPFAGFPSPPPERVTEEPAPSEAPAFAEPVFPPFAAEPPIPVAAEASPAEASDADAEARSLAVLMDRFLEAVQVGSDERADSLTKVLAQCDALAGIPDVPEDLRQYIQYLMDFLQYISANQLLDDVRVMNMVSNIQDPLSQWVRMSPADRSGLLDPAFEILRDFRAMFE